MTWLDLAAYFFGGMFMANAIPHLVAGMMGRAFQTPFARPPGAGLSSSTVNVLWGLFNMGIAYALICRVGDFGLKNAQDMVALSAGVLVIAVFAARYFGRFHGGNTPAR
jgi:hypothetical protein